MKRGFSFARFKALFIKEFIQMRRDRVTFGMMIGLPIVQLMLFGFAINADPRHLPTLVEMGDNGPLSRAVIVGMAQSGYFDFKGEVMGTAAGEEALRRGEANLSRRASSSDLIRAISLASEARMERSSSTSLRSAMYSASILPRSRPVSW